MNASTKTPPAPFSGHADDALGQAVATMRPGWTALRGCVLDTGDAAPVPVAYALLHPQVGIALLDLVPGRTTPHAPDHLRRTLNAAAFGCIPPILYFCIPVRALPDVGYLLEHEFSRQPPSPLPRGDAWVTAAQAILSAQPLPPPRQLASSMDNQPLRHAPPAWQQPARRFGSARLLAGFWGLAVLTVGGGALFLQFLGPPEQAARAAAPLPVAKAEAGQGPPATADRAPSAKADASSPANADLRRTLIENDRAIRELQSRLKGSRADAGSGMVANAVLTTATLPGAPVERRVGTAARPQQLADNSEETDTTPAQEAAPGQSPAPPTQDAAPRPAEVAAAEAALQQIRADAEAAQKRLADTNAQVERAAQQAKAAEQQLTTLQRQAEDAQNTGAEVGKQLTDAQAQLNQLEERRSAAEQQLQSLQAQADRAQADQAVVEQQLAAARAQLAEQQAQADHAKKDAADAEARPAEPREPEDRAVAQPSPADAQPEASPSTASTAPAAPVESAHAAPAPAESAAPAPAPAAPASRDNTTVAAVPSAAAPVVPSRVQDPAAAALTETMIRRGDALLQRGDISAARLLYDRAASAGSAHAATAMGKTYDAAILAGIGVVGLSPDPVLAALWYRRGLSLGDEEARTRLQSLPPAAGQAAARPERP